jgi:DNA-binding transcriptional MocR family regulator
MTPVQKLMLIDRISKDPELTNRDVRVAIQIVQHFNAAKGRAWPSIRHLAALLHMSKNTVQSAVNALQKAGWIVRKSGGLGSSNVYQFEVSRVPKPTPPRTKNEKAAYQQVGTYKDYDNPSLRRGKNNTYTSRFACSSVQAEPDQPKRDASFMEAFDG